MNTLTDQLVSSILQKESLDQCSVEELQRLSNLYPYFGPLQLLLVKKLQGGDPAAYKKQIQTTSLHFYHPLWLQTLLNGLGGAEILAAEKEEKDDSLPLSTVAGALRTESHADFESDFSAVITDKTLPGISEISNQQVEIPISNEPEPVIEIPSIKIEPFDPNSSGPIFEPYYTVDYFASQGIRFKEEESPVDKFGQQLKSFTEWLKTLRRLPVPEITGVIEVNAEQKIEQLAGRSLEDREVITEAMAAVWEKQGNRAKAAEIYNKLSLLEPSKSAYFAAKISALKKTD